jgi:hypothetical protein
MVENRIQDPRNKHWERAAERISCVLFDVRGAKDLRALADNSLHGPETWNGKR